MYRIFNCMHEPVNTSSNPIEFNWSEQITCGHDVSIIQVFYFISEFSFVSLFITEKLSDTQPRMSLISSVENVQVGGDRAMTASNDVIPTIEKKTNGRVKKSTDKIKYKYLFFLPENKRESRWEERAASASRVPKRIC